jgi:regulator of replication initiation timing
MGKKNKGRGNSKKNSTKNRKAQQQQLQFQGKRGKGRTKKISNWDKYFNEFNEWLKPKDIYMRDVDGDGNCLFRSIADQIDGDESVHRQYRDMAVKQLTDNKDFYKLFFDENEDFDKYLKEMTDNGTWGGHFELVALSAVLGVNFCLHMKDAEPYLITSGAKYNKAIRMYHLGYHIDNHYSSVRKIGDETKEPAQEILWQGKFIIENFEHENQSSTEEGEEDGESKIEEIKQAEEHDDLMRVFETITPSDYFGVCEHLFLNGADAQVCDYYGIKKEDLIVTVKPTPIKQVNCNLSQTSSSVSSQSPADPPADPNPPVNHPVKTTSGWSKTKKKKVGPNDPCHCGSGRKLKKCCKVAA